MLINSIYKRASIRKYNPESLDETTINNIKNVINSQKPLFTDINYKIDFIIDGKSFQSVLGGIIGSYGKIYAPHYLVASTELKDNAYENIGYILEYIVLKLTEMNIGTCWIGGGIKKDLFKQSLEIENNLNPVVVIALGKPINLDMFRTDGIQFKRKQIEDISLGNRASDYEKAMGLVRLAPSAINLQPWRYIFENKDLVDVYRVKNNFIVKSYIDYLNKIDLGISLCHFEIGINKNIELIDMQKNKPKLIYFKSIIIK